MEIARPQADDVEAPVLAGLDRAECRHRKGKLEHQGAAVVRDAPHDVQATRRPGQGELVFSGEELPRFGVRMSRKPVELRQELLAVSLAMGTCVLPHGFGSTGRCRGQETAAAEALLQGGLHDRADLLVGVAHPGHVRGDIQGWVQGRPVGLGDEHTELFGDERRADVVGVRAESPGPVTAVFHRGHQGPEVGEESVVAGHELVELPASADVLVLETARLSGDRRSEHPIDHLLLDGGELVANAGEEPGDGRESVVQG